MKTSLPIERSSRLEKQIHMALNYSIFQRTRHGKRLQQVVLAPDFDRDYLGISSLAQPPCALYYSLTHTKKDEHDTGTRFGFDTGHVLESYVLDMLRIGEGDRQGELVWPYLLAPGGVIKGHYDGLDRTLMQDGSCIIECKATGGYSFNKKIEEGADQGHIEQAFAYASRAGASYFALIYCNREAKKSTPFYTVMGYHIPDMEAAERAVYQLFAERFDPVLLSLHHELRPDQPQNPKYEYGPRGWRCRPDKTYFARGKNNQQVGYCSYRPVCPEARGYALTVIEKEKEKKAA